MRQTRIEFPVDGEPIDGVMCGPNDMGLLNPAVVVCHPHPLFGGSMDSPAVFAICAALAERGVASMRFNFRRTTGDAPGIAAQAARDTAAAFEVIRQWEFVDGRRCALAGYSFGATAILRGLADLRAARALALIAPPMSALDDSEIARDTRPKLFIVGDSDRLVDAESLRAAAAGMTEPVEIEILEGAGHTLAGDTEMVGERVAEFLARVLGR